MTSRIFLAVSHVREERVHIKRGVHEAKRRSKKRKEEKIYFKGIRAVGKRFLCLLLGSLFTTELSGLLHQNVCLSLQCLHVMYKQMQKCCAMYCTVSKEVSSGKFLHVILAKGMTSAVLLRATLIFLSKSVFG